MTTFTYQARNRSGERFNGTVEAENLRAAAQTIRQQGLWIARLEAQPSGGAKRRLAGLVKNWVRPSTVSAKTVVLFCRQLTVLLTAGLPVHEALRALQVRNRRDRYQRLLDELLQAVEQGKSLAEAMQDFPRVFSPMVVSLIRAGESGGALEAVFSRLADFQEKSYAAGEKMKAVLLYPVILGLTTLIAFVFMTVFILPTFASMLINLHTELPLLTRGLLVFSAVVQAHGLLLLLGGLGLSGAAMYLYQQPAVRLQADRLCLSVPFYGRLRRDTAWMMVLGTLSLLLESGIPLHQALETVRPVAGNLYLQVQLKMVGQAVESGRALAASLSNCHEFPAMLRELLQAGERAGALDETLQKAAEFCSVTAENESQQLQALAEPLAILLVGGLVFCFVLSIILPLLGVVDYMV